MNGWVIALAIAGALAVLITVVWILVPIYVAWHESLMADAVAEVRKDLAKKGVLEEVPGLMYGDRYRKPYSTEIAPTWDEIAALGARIDKLANKITKKKDKA